MNLYQDYDGHITELTAGQWLNSMPHWIAPLIWIPWTVGVIAIVILLIVAIATSLGKPPEQPPRS